MTKFMKLTFSYYTKQPSAEFGKFGKIVIYSQNYAIQSRQIKLRNLVKFEKLNKKKYLGAKLPESSQGV